MASSGESLIESGLERERETSTVLVTGATGYVGGRLVPRLLERGHRVRVLVRDPVRIEGREWVNDVHVVRGDLLGPASLPAAFDGIRTAFYLVHSMAGGGDFAARDREAANNFVRAGRGVHTIYLGGLVPSGQVRSKHLGSRVEVGEILRRELPTTEFRAGPIIGSGSASFEMVRYLTERLPAMVAPRWIRNTVQPVAIRDVLSYLIEALDREPLGVVEIGADQLRFVDMMKVYAAVRGLRRVIVPVPILAPQLAARWVGLVTPISNRLAVPLIKGILRPVLADTGRARELFPEIQPLPYREAVRVALESVDDAHVETRWSGALGESPSYDLRDWKGLIREVRTRHVRAEAETVFAVFNGLGGRRGWLAWNWAWWLRGLLDKMLGGPGLRRGRRDPDTLLPGEVVDFWRVERVKPPDLLRLRAEMKLPGRAWLQWETTPQHAGCRLTQTALFAPRGLSGLLYWYTLYPIHRLIFSRLARAVARRAEAVSGGA